jgi:hypothetical protein
VPEAPHIEGERSALTKQLMGFLQHVCTYRCSAVLWSSPVRLQAMFADTVLPSLQSCLSGGGPVIGGRASVAATPSKTSSLALRKSSLGIVTGLLRALLGTEASPSTVGGAAIAAPASSDPPPTVVVSMFQTFLLDIVLPAVMLMLTPNPSVAATAAASSRTSLNTRDAAAQGVIADTAVLLWSLFGMPGAPETLVPFMHSLLARLGWPPAAASICVSQLEARAPLGSYKESFRLLIREGGKLSSKTDTF